MQDANVKLMRQFAMQSISLGPQEEAEKNPLLDNDAGRNSANETSSDPPPTPSES